MTYLQLCQALILRAGISGSMATVQGQSGEMLRVVNWIASAYQAIQTEHSNWEFMRGDVQFNTATPVNTYTPADAGVAGLGAWRWRGNDWRCWLGSAGPMDEQPLAFVDYNEFKRLYGYGSQRLAIGRPLVITERPNKSLLIYPIPADIYTVIGEQYQAPLVMLNDNDVPVFDAQFHDVIVFRAMQLYGAFEGDTAVFTFGQAECARVLSLLEDKQLPKWTASETLA